VQLASGVNVEEIVAVPEQVAEPLESVAVVGGTTVLAPLTEMFSVVPLAMVFAPVKVTVAAAPVAPLLNPLRLQVCPAVPVIDPPDT
jgi:hypothetical protein